MAMPFIIHHNENIYNLEEKEKNELKKPPRYNSKFRSQVRLEMTSANAINKTMGYAEVPLDPPDKFLKSGGGVKRIPAPIGQRCTHSKLPVVPKRNATAKHTPASTNTDFKAQNINTVVKSAPVRPIPRYVDTRTGDFHDLKRSGCMPYYVFAPKFGKLPKYLIKRIRDAATEDQLFRDAEIGKQPLCKYVTQEERSELLEGLKHNWEELQKVYRGLPVMTDTIPKIIRKTKLENDLKQLERDILLVENHPYIYVYSNNPSQ